MAMKNVRTNLKFGNSFVILHNFNSFPSTPDEGTLVLKDGVIWTYSTISGNTQWYPLTNKKRSFTYSQNTSATVWNVNHGLGTQNLLYMVYGSSGGYEIANIEFVDDNNVNFHLTEPSTGKVVIFADEAGTFAGGGAGGGDVDLTDYLRRDGGNTITGDIIPDIDNTRSIGSSASAFKDVFIGPGSLYINGKQVISDVSDKMVFKTDPDQSLQIQTSGTGVLDFKSDTGGVKFTTTNNGDVEFNPGNGLVQVKSGLQITAGKQISTSDGSPVLFNGNIQLGTMQIAENSIGGVDISNGLVAKGSDGKVPSNDLPSIALSNVSVVADVINLPNSPQEGDVGIVTGEGKSYVYDGTQWQELLVDHAVDSVNGRTGNITLTKSDVSLGNVLNVAQTENKGNTPSIQAGLLADRPATGVIGALYISTDEMKVYRDSGSNWVVLTPSSTISTNNPTGGTHGDVWYKVSV